MSAAETTSKKKPQDLVKKNMQAVVEKKNWAVPETAFHDFRTPYKAAARDALSRAQQELATEEIEQKF